ncbi:hypothetical protein CN325_01280 [Bacillus thuringiensis]|nr:hypothetical protein CN325_01280 [Bacillus thuringiensis]
MPGFLFYPAIRRTVRPSPQNSAEAKKLGGGLLPLKARLVRANNQWGCPPLIKVSLYIETSNSFTYTAVPAISICNFSFSIPFVT